MLRIDQSLVEQKFPIPDLFFTIAGNKKSEEVVGALRNILGESVCRVFQNRDEIKDLFMDGYNPDAAVVLFDGSLAGEFSPKSSTRLTDKGFIPPWASGVLWGVLVSLKITNVERCARQIAADFRKKFEDRLEEGKFPWGLPKKSETGPKHIHLPNETLIPILARLNSSSAPDLSGIISDMSKAAEIPKNSKISWIRVPAAPIGIEREYLAKVTDALERFQSVSAELLKYDIRVQEALLAGVDLPADPRLKDLYLFPPTDRFSVSRPDLHFTGSGLFASENDEMPGGFPEAVHIDESYGLHQTEWRQTFDWLTKEGPLLFLVSHEWSGCYIREMKWLADYLRTKGYPVLFATTENLSELAIDKDKISYQGERVGMVWRQFPIFETMGKLADVVEAASKGIVRLIPEFAHYGNKTWFSIFRSHATYFKESLGEEAFNLLLEVLPDSHLVTPTKLNNSFPFGVAEIKIGSLEALKHLSLKERNELVMKVAGANTKSARSYGVLMGHGLKDKDWVEWIDERLESNQPFIVQQKLQTEVVKLPVRNISEKRDELFRCRVLVRPWIVNGRVVSGIATAVPYTTERVHGMVDMAMSPISLY